ncbi:MAG TPA: M1 family aminopeptidase [Pyrinomonadaceae bacterium]|nr:M1 family aminopeptidase [Pyrinomonadaceae bacterium]
MKRFLAQRARNFRLATRAILAALVLLATVGAQEAASQQTPSTPAAEAKVDNAPHTRYRINLQLDFDNRTYTGTEQLRWVNRDDHPTSTLYFHLYSNMRANLQRNSHDSASAAEPDEPVVEVSEVRSLTADTPLTFSLEDQATVLRVNLKEPVAANSSTEISIKFKGSVPEIDPEETGLIVHVLQQVGAALRSEREIRRARDINYRSKGVMLLGTSYPVLAARDGNDWQRKVETTIGDMLFAEPADYEVAVDAPADVNLFAAAVATATSQKSERDGNIVREFEGSNLRDFAIVAGRELRSEERTVGGVTVRSVFMQGHETTGRRVLAEAADAVRVFSARFGALPFKLLSIVDAPLVAGLGSVEFSGLGVIASAFYVDFDSPAMRNLPEIVRDQRASLEDSLEFTVAHVAAQQWWGVAVGNNPEKDPVLDEALANWSALLYYKDVHGEERAQSVLDDQLRGVYKVYRTFGGEDMAATRAAREYRNFFQYAAIVSSKGALMFVELHKLVGDEKFFAALRRYYDENKFEVAQLDDLRGAFLAETPRLQRRAVMRTFSRWLSEKRGDEDIAPPDPKLAAALGINPKVAKNDRNAFTRLGRFFWQQMTRLR